MVRRMCANSRRKARAAAGGWVDAQIYHRDALAPDDGDFSRCTATDALRTRLAGVVTGPFNY